MNLNLKKLPCAKMALVALLCTSFVSVKAESADAVKNVSFEAVGSSPTWKVPESATPQPFVLHAEKLVLPANTRCDLYLADEYFHVEGKKPDMSFDVIDNTLHIELPLTKVRSGRLAMVKAGQKKPYATLDLFLVPNATIGLQVFGDSLAPDLSSDYKVSHNYLSRIERSILNERQVKGCKSPYVTAPKGEVWEAVKQQKSVKSVLSVQDVTLGKKSTTVHFLANNSGYTVDLSKYNICLKDGQGKEYRLRRRVGEKTDKAWSPEALVYGAYYEFEALPAGTPSFSVIFVPKTGHMDSFQIADIQKADPTEMATPNFKMNIKVSEGISDCGYLVHVYNKDATEWRGDHETIADIEVGDDRKCSFSTHLDGVRFGALQAIFPDGSVCTHIVNFVFVPGEEANVKVKYGEFQLSGSKFYEDFSNAQDNLWNARHFENPEEREQIKNTYFEKHKGERGCLWSYLLSRAISQAQFDMLIKSAK